MPLIAATCSWHFPMWSLTLMVQQLSRMGEMTDCHHSSTDGDTQWDVGNGLAAVTQGEF